MPKAWYLDIYHGNEGDHTSM